MALTTVQRLVRRSIKRFIYTQLAIVEATRIMRGQSKPLIRFTVEGTPPSVYFNFRVREDKLDELRKLAGVPESFALAKIRCRADEEPFYALTLNVYRVSGLTNGLRAEWSVYVSDEQSKPRYMIVEARSSQASMDPIEIITRPTELTHEIKANKIECRVESQGRSFFTASVPLPEDKSAPVFKAAPEWIEANDRIFWRNGVCDRAFYDGALACASMRELDANLASIRDETPWAQLIDPKPAHIAALTESTELVISPWWNV